MSVSPCAFETALEGIDRIIDWPEGKGSSTMEAIGWEIFDQSTGELLLVLEPHAAARRRR